MGFIVNFEENLSIREVKWFVRGYIGEWDCKFFNVFYIFKELIFNKC